MESPARRRGRSPARLPDLVFAYRRQCGTSRKMESVVAWVKVTRKARVRVVPIDVDSEPELTRRLDVTETPSLVLVKDRRVVGRLEGKATGRQIEDLLSEYLDE